MKKKKKNTLKPSEASSNCLIGAVKEEQGPCQIRTGLTAPLERGVEGLNRANNIIRGEIRWPEMRVRKFELWEIMCGENKVCYQEIIRPK